MKWILIFWLSHGFYDSFGTPTTAVEFNDEASCKAAFQQIKAVNDGEFRLRGVCVKKDESSNHG
ncbi:hypothetical protein GCM10022405_40970 [Gibbsiella dentisursi]|uniref:Uncharacterized protein n=1 Tax=Gibbsiella dentisursi TaxID=796890 RepID=A0ABP7M3Z8_9GAMM